LYSKDTLEVGRLEQCLDAFKTTLSTSEEETNVAQMRADEAHASAAGKISLRIFAFIFTPLSGNPSFSLDLEEQLVASCHEIKEVRRREILENRHETLQCAALGVVASVNARGVSLGDRL